MRFACFEAIFFLDWNSFFFFVWNTIVILFRIFEIFLGRFILKRMIISRILFLIKSYTFYYFFSRWRRKLLLLLSMKWNRILCLLQNVIFFLPMITNIASCYENQWTIFWIIVQEKMFQYLLKLFIKYLA